VQQLPAQVAPAATAKVAKQGSSYWPR
jgi:hypothetical protein